MPTEYPFNDRLIRFPELEKIFGVCKRTVRRRAESGELPPLRRIGRAVGMLESRVAMTLMRHSDRRLTDKIYTDENLLGTWAAFDALSNYAEQASQGASHELVAVSQNGSSAVTTNGGGKSNKTIATIDERLAMTPLVTSGHNYDNGGSGGARTRNLCRDRAAL